MSCSVRAGEATAEFVRGVVREDDQDFEDLGDRVRGRLLGQAGVTAGGVPLSQAGGAPHGYELLNYFSP
jgi:hypothetical protein